MVKTINTRWGKAVKAVVTLEIYHVLPEYDRRGEIPDEEAVLHIKNELATTSNTELVNSQVKLINQQ